MDYVEFTDVKEARTYMKQGMQVQRIAAGYFAAFSPCMGEVGSAVEHTLARLPEFPRPAGCSPRWHWRSVHSGVRFQRRLAFTTDNRVPFRTKVMVWNG